jgi:hypothetical protein
MVSLSTPLPAAEEITDSSQRLESFHLDFEARYGILRGDITLDLETTDEPGLYHYEIVTRARGLARLVRSGTGRESSRFRYSIDGFQPVHYVREDGTDDSDNDSDIRFDWSEKIAHSVYEGEAKDIPIHTGMLDRLAADIIVINELRAGRNPTGYDIVDRNSVRRYEFTELGEEQMEVPAGTFDTVKYRRQRPGSSRSTLIWYAKDHNFLPIRIEQQKRGKTAITMVAMNIAADR